VSFRLAPAAKICQAVRSSLVDPDAQPHALPEQRLPRR
jgi:hypothetical protein